jgi:nucleoside phosphorylase
MPESSKPGPTTAKQAIVAAMTREVAPLIKHWRSVRREFENRSFEFFEKDDRVLVCDGIGPEAARRAAVAVIALYRPQQITSAGFAGALDSSLHVGDLLCPEIVINASDGSRIQTVKGQGVLVSFASVAGAEQKSALARAFQAQAVDMEAAAVGAAAAAGGVAFDAVKSISDELGFQMPLMDRYVDAAGQFQTTKFALATAVRPWLWNHLRLLARNSSIASRSLCEHFA